MDLVSSIPFDLLAIIFSGASSGSAITASRGLKVMRLARLLTLIKLLRMSRLCRYMSRWEDLIQMNSAVLRMAKLIVLMLLITHWNACLQYLVVSLSGYPQDSWVSKYGIQNKDAYHRYTWAFFNALSHMLCIGSFDPHTHIPPAC